MLTVEAIFRIPFVNGKEIGLFLLSLFKYREIGLLFCVGCQCASLPRLGQNFNMTAKTFYHKQNLELI